MTTRQRRTKTTYYPVSEQWKLDIQAEMTRQGISRMEMARAINVSHSAISVLFNQNTRSSKLVPMIERVLGLPPRRESRARTELQHRWELVYDRLNEDQVKKLLEMAELIATTPPKEKS